MTSSAPHQPFPYLDPTCILWCTTEGSNTINDFLSTLPPNFLPSFLNECVKVIDLVHDHWRKKDTGGLTDSQLAIWETLKQWPIDPDQLLKVMQVYSDGKFRRGVTFKGVVDLSKGSMDDTAYTTAQQTLYNKVFPIGQREIHRMTLEQQAGLQPLQRPHPGLQKLRDQRNRNTESRKKRKFGDTVDDQVDAMESMRKMKKDLPTFAFGVDERGIKMVGKKHDGLVVLEKGKGKEKVVEVDGKEEET